MSRAEESGRVSVHFGWLRFAPAASGVILTVATVLALMLAAGGQAGAAVNRAYVVDYNTGNVQRVDTEVNSLLANPFVTGLGSLQQPQITPNGKYLYLPDYASDKVRVYNLETNQFHDDLDAADGPMTVGFSPDSSLAYVLNHGAETVQVFGIPSGNLVDPGIPVGGDPHSLVLSPDGSLLYVAAKGDGEIMVIDTATRQQDGIPIPVDPDPYYLAISPDGNRLYFSDDYALGYARVVNTQTRQLVASNVMQLPSGEAEDLAISPDGTQGWLVGTTAGQVLAFNPLTMEAVGEPVNVGTNPYQLAITPDGSKAFVPNYLSGGISVINTADRGLFSPIADTNGPWQIAITPNQPPEVFLAGPLGIRAGEPAKFSTPDSGDPDGFIAKYDWDFGDGTTLTTDPNQLDVLHVYKKPGRYLAKVTATDNEGCSTTYIATTETAYCNGSDIADASLEMNIDPADNRFSFGKVKLNKRKGTASLQVRLPGPGTIKLGGKGIRAARKTARKAGKVNLTVKVKGKAKRTLNRKRRTKVRAKVTFTPSYGAARTKTRAVMLKRR